MKILVPLINFTSRLLKAIWLYLAGIIAVGAIYYLLTGVEQGIDVVIQAGEFIWSGIFSVLAVFLWAFLVWYSCRLLSYIKQKKDDEIFSAKGSDDVTSAILYKKYCIPTFIHQYIPRMLAYNCFVSIQVAIFHLPTFYSSGGLQMFMVIVLHNVFYFLLSEWYQSGPATKKRNVLNFVNGGIIIGYSALLIYEIIGHWNAGILYGDVRHTFWLRVIALVVFGLQVLSVYLFILRRRRVDINKNDPSIRRSPLLARLGFNPRYNAAEARYFRILNGITTGAVFIYLATIFSVFISDSMGPMAFTLLALGILTGFSNLITLLSIRVSFNVFIIIYAFAFLFGQFREPYSVRLLETDGAAIFTKRPTTKQYLKNWFNKRLSMLDTSDTTKLFPVYIILSNGGASRAGKWTSSVLCHLQDTSYSINPRNNFKEHVLCIAGASGGTVGNCAFYSLLKAEQEKRIKPNEFQKHAGVFFKTDFLTYTLARLLGPDIFRHILFFNIPVYNRADALEYVVSNGSKDDILNSYFNRPVTEVFDTTGVLPILYINTTQVDNGMPGVISPVKLPAESQRTDVLTLVDSMGVKEKKGNLKLSTAAILSSRFPYVSPAGKVFDRYYVDGGYFDNSGAGMVLEFIQELNSFLADSANAEILKFRNRFTFHIVHITNSEIRLKPSPDIHPLTNDLLTPILTLAGMQGASTNIGNGVLRNNFKQFNSDTTNALIQYSLYDESWGDSTRNAGKFEEGYPMSWAISGYQLNRMKLALDRANRRNLWKFTFDQ